MKIIYATWKKRNLGVDTQKKVKEFEITSIFWN